MKLLHNLPRPASMLKYRSAFRHDIGNFVAIIIHNYVRVAVAAYEDTTRS
jgi:hypothetical protein